MQRCCAGTVERMLPNHDVYVTDWRDAKMAPMSAGSFDLDDYIDYVIDWLAAITPEGSPGPMCSPSASPRYPSMPR
jgi:poly(3-hydroxybutyrate) depolymerase